VIRSYVEVKLARGKQKWEIDPKLSMLENEVRSKDLFNRNRSCRGLAAN
jgi:hypothetical protein